MTDKELLALSADDFRKLMVIKFPDIFRDIDKSPQETCMCWGFEVGPGWYPLIYKLCVKLLTLSELTKVTFIADQVKEKFGTLRFYWHSEGSTATMVDAAESIANDIVDKAERRSAYTCERCGDHGRVVCIRGWYTALCEEHRNKREQANETLSKSSTETQPEVDPSTAKVS